MRVLVTGGAGFIGSHAVDQLIRARHRVVVYDNLTTGQEIFIRHHKKNPNFRFIRADMLNRPKLLGALKGCRAVFHFAANADVRGGINNTRVDLEQNTIATHRLLEAMRALKIKEMIFASSATVYGEPAIFPTPETSAAIQTSLYGATKLAAEALIQAYGEYYGIRSWIFRFVSFTGERYTHGVVFDFIKKLNLDPRNLLILGDGRQKKSYLDVGDGVDAIMLAWRKSDGAKRPVFNLGHDYYLNVDQVAGIVTRALGPRRVRFSYSGGARGWPGDSPYVHLDTSKIKALGWRPKIPIEESIKNTVKYLLSNPGLMERH